MAINLDIASKHLDGRRADRLAVAVRELEAAVTSGVVRNVVFNEAKDSINRAVEASAEAFLATGPHKLNHHQSDWWLGAYDVDALVSGVHGLPAALKRATPKHEFTSRRSDLVEYRAFLTALLPLRDLLESAKPLIVKGLRLPKEKTPEQIAREAKTMTCQCCGRPILANMGSIAHHGYQRPGYGYQTASCHGATKLPFEVDRAVLGEWIGLLRDMRKRMQAARRRVAGEALPIRKQVEDRSAPRVRGQRQPMIDVELTRACFDELQAKYADEFRMYGWRSFDEVKAADLAYRDHEIEAVGDDINFQQKRFDGWSQTHERRGDEWVSVK